MDPIISFWSNFQSRDELKKYGNNALLLYAIDLSNEIEDIDAFASEYMVEGSNDKKSDLIYVDFDRQTAIIAQSYFSQTRKREAPANKASDLGTAFGWLFTSDLRKVPKNLKDYALELRNSIENNTINTIEFWYVHNCYESKNVQNELDVVVKNASGSIRTYFPNNRNIQIKTIEVGLNTIEEWYKATKATILVDEDIEIDVPGGYEIEQNDWKAFSTSIPLSLLQELFSKHKKKLFSANVRDYLGSRKSDSNINNGIKNTAANEPSSFWPYNNGITALVNDFTPDDKENIKKITIKGISIVNGAQTTGAIATVDDLPKTQGFVSARFIKCSNPVLINNIIRFNNSQNKISPSDFRSTDLIQERLRNEFDNYSHSVSYSGGRRGGEEDRIKRPQNYISFEKVTQSLCAFHNMPGIAYNNKSEIWENDSYYSKIFNSDTSADHIVFVYSLFKNISDHKLKLMSAGNKNDSLVPTAKSALDFLRKRGSIYIFIAAIASSLEVIIQKPVPNRFHFKFKNKPSIDDAVGYWTSIISSTISFNMSLSKAVDTGLKNSTNIQESIEQFRTFVDSTKIPLASLYSDFASRIKI